MSPAIPSGTEYEDKFMTQFGVITMKRPEKQETSSKTLVSITGKIEKSTALHIEISVPKGDVTRVDS